MPTHRSIILYIAMSLDGYIAGPNDDLTFLDAVQVEGEDYGYTQFYDTVDTVIMGRKTYDVVKGLGVPQPHAGKETYILTRTPKPSEENVHFYTGSIVELIAQLKSTEGKNVFIDGGSQTVHRLLTAHLIDELVVSVIPVLLGKGIPLFIEGRPLARLKLQNSKAYPTGLVQLHYQVLENA
ncbi:MAG: dihydrofolate reductase family protein [Bacteroidota bacterium]